MNKNLLYIIVSGAVLIGGAGYLLLQDNDAESGAPRSGDLDGAIVVGTSCDTACAQAETACPSLIDETSCVTKCETMSAEAKEHLQNSSTCEALTARPDLISGVLIPDVADTSAYEAEAEGNGCEASCNNYVATCLSLVPNATQNLLSEGYDSCMSECAEWDSAKASCIATALDCPSMTEVCGL
jgi:hypothetical protein